MSTPSSSDPSRFAARALALVFVAAGASGCQRKSEAPEAHAARTAVARYNQALVEAFRSLDQERLAAVATEAERNRVGAIIAGLLSRGQVMVARPTEQRVVDVSRLREDLFEVRTVETWVYEHRAANARDAPVEPKTLTYRMAYQVRRFPDGWLVQHAGVREDEAPAPRAAAP